MIDQSAIRAISRTGDARLDGLLFGTAWAGAVSYGFPGSATVYGPGYGRFDPGVGSFYAANPEQRLALQAILDADRQDPRQQPAAAGFSVEGFTRLEVAFAGPGNAMLRMANSAAIPTAYAYLPAPDAAGGDMWFGGMGGDPRRGTSDFTAVLHEAGHSLGLKHPHEAEASGPVPLAWDSPEFSVMTYRPWQGGPTTGSRYPDGAAPQTFMMLDIAALQHLYGADFTTNAGDTTYAWDPATGASLVNGAPAIVPTTPTIFLTVWDGGGRDTYDFANFTADLRVDLAPGAASMLGTDHLAWLGGGPNGGFARGSVFNALQSGEDPRSLIENAVGGPGNDILRGNAAANRLVGNAGNDRLDGRAGADTMIGGPGNDVYVADVSRDRAVETWAGAAGGRDTVVSSASLRLGANIETLMLVERAIAGGGNGLGNALIGNAFDNRLSGRGGNDQLIGHGGGDLLFGGEGRDLFRFFSVADSTPRHFDRLMPAGPTAAFEGAGPARGDRIDLRGIDADEGEAGNQAFHFGSRHGAGSLWAQEWRGNTYIRANVNGDDAFDFQIRIDDGDVRASAYTVHDFLL